MEISILGLVYIIKNCNINANRIIIDLRFFHLSGQQHD